VKNLEKITPNPRFVLRRPALLGLLASLGLMSHASAQTFQISAVNPLSGDQTSIAMGINNAGTLVGTSYDANGNGHAFYLQGGAQAALTTLGGSTSEATGISSDGRIAGSSALSSGLTHACYWISGTPTDADPANVYGPSRGLAINSSGVLAGYFTNGSNQPQGFTFSGSPLTAVDYPSATQTTVNGINDQGLLAGSYTGAGAVFGFMENGATFQTLPNLSGGTQGQANAINRATDLAGWVTNSSDHEQAAIWRNNTLILLGDLGGNYGEAMDLNNYGQAVGASNIAASSYTPDYTANGNKTLAAAGSLAPMNDSLSHAFLWQNGVLYDLNAFLPGNSGWILQCATGINDSGQIVGYGTLNGVLTAYVLTPAASTPVSGAGALSLSQSAYTTTNSNGTVTITVTRNGGTTGVVSAQIATAPGTASAGADFTPVYQTVTFANGQGGSQTVTVPIVYNPQVSGSDTFTVQLFWITGGAAQGSTTLATVTVQRKGTATVTFGPLSALFDGTSKSVTATTNPTGLNVTLTYNGSSTAPSALGSYTVVATVNDPNYTGSATGTFVIAASQTFSQWANQKFTRAQLAEPAFIASASTPFNDGVANLLKYVFDIQPSAPMSAADRAALPTVGTTPIGETPYLTLTYRQYQYLSSDVTINVQTSSDLQTWTTVTPDINQQTALADGDITTEVGVNMTGVTKKFIRLNVTSP